MFKADELLDPISPDSPAGEDLAFSPDLDAIAHARRFDDPSLEQGEWVTELKEADWDFVEERCAALLRTRSKDLRLAVWLTEAGAKTDGLAAMAEGIRVIAGLCQDYWDMGLYPESDGDDHDQRIGNLSWILGRIPALVREVPLTEPRHGSHTAIDIETARKAANGGGDQAAAALTALESARRNTSPQFYAGLAAAADACLAALKELEQVADERLGHDSPGFSAARDGIDNLKRMIPTPAVSAAPAPVAASDTGTPSAASAHAAPVTMVAVPVAQPGVLQNRAQALAQLRAVAEFFRQTEPHSPVSYFADKAADAGEMSLHEWLRTVVKDSGSMSHIEEMLGVRNDG